MATQTPIGAIVRYRFDGPIPVRATLSGGNFYLLPGYETTTTFLTGFANSYLSKQAEALNVVPLGIEITGITEPITVHLHSGDLVFNPGEETEITLKQLSEILDYLAP